MRSARARVDWKEDNCKQQNLSIWPEEGREGEGQRRGKVAIEEEYLVTQGVV